jgi:hypothetical protein
MLNRIKTNLAIFLLCISNAFVASQAVLPEWIWTYRVVEVLF